MSQYLEFLRYIQSRGCSYEGSQDIPYTGKNAGEFSSDNLIIYCSETSRLSLVFIKGDRHVFFIMQSYSAYSVSINAALTKKNTCRPPMILILATYHVRGSCPVVLQMLWLYAQAGLYISAQFTHVSTQRAHAGTWQVTNHRGPARIFSNSALRETFTHCNDIEMTSHRSRCGVIT